MELSTFRNSNFDRGASRAKELAWLVCSALFISGPVPGSRWRAAILRAFGARIGRNVVIKPRIRVKFPWRLMVGNYTWIGEGVWIDNLAQVTIGDNVCISQEAYLCTGNHDWSSTQFDLITAGIRVDDHCWIGARATVAPGSYLREGAILSLGCVGVGEMQGWTIYAAGKPTVIKSRRKPERQQDA